MLAAAPRTQYIHEPFNLHVASLTTPLDYWYKYIREDDSGSYTSIFSELLRGRYPLRRKLLDIRTRNKLLSSGAIRELAGISKEAWRYFQHRKGNARQIIKDPIALFSAEWLSKAFAMDVLVMVRHPAAFCSSIKLKNWRTDFNHFLSQPALLDRYLRNYENRMREQVETPKDIISNAALLWNCTHHTISLYQKQHPDWLFVKHEDLSVDPIDKFRRIYDALGLEFTRDVKEAISDSSGPHNTIEQKVESEFVRNSRENISNWKRRLTELEVDQIRTATSGVWPLFYTEDEW
jgi:hypothetical protein